MTAIFDGNETFRVLGPHIKAVICEDSLTLDGDSR